MLQKRRALGVKEYLEDQLTIRGASILVVSGFYKYTECFIAFSEES
jgi:hypothetical protein